MTTQVTSAVFIFLTAFNIAIEIFGASEVVPWTEKIEGPR